MPTLFDFTPRAADGTPHPLGAYRGQVVLVVNTASKCGFTPQYEGLEALYRQYRDQGFTILGFPCNQFGAQEPGTAEQIATFCTTKYDVTFPILAKIDVNGGNADPVYQWLKQQKSGLLGLSAIKWNFSKFLIGRDGAVVARYAPTDSPASLAGAIEAALAQPAPAAHVNG